MRPLPGVEDPQSLAQAIVDTIHEPLLVLDSQLTVVSASRSFYETFQVDPAHTLGTQLYALGDGQWNIPALRELLETIIPERASMNGFEVNHAFPGLGQRTMLLNARKVRYATSDAMTILLAFTDVTERRILEREKEELLVKAEALLLQKQLLLAEMQHRVANSLQIIASILMLKARNVTSDEVRLHLTEAHQRVMSVAAVQSHLHAGDAIDQIEVGLYLSKLCASLASSMVGDGDPIDIKVVGDSRVIGSNEAVSLGLIVTELVINAIKYAFPGPRTDARVLITYESGADGDWRLTVSDNGVGKSPPRPDAVRTGLGTVIVDALVKQMGANMSASETGGVTVVVQKGDFAAAAPRTA